MKKLFFTTLLVCFGLLARAEYNVTSVIYDGNGQQCNYWVNNGGVEAETLTEMDMPYDGGISGIAKYLEMKRVQNSDYDWHGIGFDLSGLNTTIGAGNQIAMWVKKDKAENVKLELQFTDGTAAVLSGLQWVAPEDGWKYLVFDLSSESEEIQARQLSTMYVQTHTGGSDGQVATVQVTGIVKGFDLADLPEPTAVDETSAPVVFAENGRIYCDGDFTVINIAGQDVTAQNGNLQGIFIVMVNGKAVKVNVK